MSTTKRQRKSKAKVKRARHKRERKVILDIETRSVDGDGLPILCVTMSDDGKFTDYQFLKIVPPENISLDPYQAVADATRASLAAGSFQPPPPGVVAEYPSKIVMVRGRPHWKTVREVARDARRHTAKLTASAKRIEAILERNAKGRQAVCTLGK